MLLYEGINLTVRLVKTTLSPTPLINTTSSPGTYNPVEGSSEARACIDCPAGEYCETAALETPTGDCNAGYYCLAGSASNEVSFRDLLESLISSRLDIRGLEIWVLTEIVPSAALVTTLLGTVCIYDTRLMFGHCARALTKYRNPHTLASFPLPSANWAEHDRKEMPSWIFLSWWELQSYYLYCGVLLPDCRTLSSGGSGKYNNNRSQHRSLRYPVH